VRVSSSNLRSWELRRKDEQQTEWPA
jgi:hypothetical protein